MPKIDYLFWFGVWTSVLLWAASGSVSMMNVFPETWIPWVKGWSMFLGSLNSTILTAWYRYSKQ